LATIHQRYRRTDGQTDGRISYGIGLDLTVGQKLPNYKNTTELYTRPLQNQIANKSFYHNSKHIVIQQSVYKVFFDDFQ